MSIGNNQTWQKAEIDGERARVRTGGVSQSDGRRGHSPRFAKLGSEMFHLNAEWTSSRWAEMPGQAFPAWEQLSATLCSWHSATWLARETSDSQTLKAHKLVVLSYYIFFTKVTSMFLISEVKKLCSNVREAICNPVSCVFHRCLVNAVAIFALQELRHFHLKGFRRLP